ncbi:HupE/UreJ family protein [Shimia sp.]|uniref:HupE/UreJ family protein n=1 Tax=Shimia sp. TaxID=1954381 RepID=UPI003BA8FAF6
MTRVWTYIYGAMAAILSIVVACGVQAHELDPGYVDIRPFGGQQYSVSVRVPDVQGAPMDVSLRLPERCDPGLGPKLRSDGQAWQSGWITTCEGGLAGHVIAIDGLDAQRTDVLLRVVATPGDGAQTARLTSHTTQFVVSADPGALAVFGSYFPLGFEHILEGYDHLLFVFALMLLVGTMWQLVGAVTAFTVAHSITLGLSALDVIRVPGPPVEAVIALSIVFLALEILRGQNSAAGRNPWRVCFLFGLLHGLGFAGALREIGLPQQDILAALVAFNLGVEAGQLVFVAVMAGLLFAGRWTIAQMRRDRAMTPVLRTVSGYGIGAVATFWFAERLAGF